MQPKVFWTGSGKPIRLLLTISVILITLASCKSGGRVTSDFCILYEVPRLTMEEFLRFCAEARSLFGADRERALDAAIDKATAELGEGATEDDILERAEEIMSGDAQK